MRSTEMSDGNTSIMHWKEGVSAFNTGNLSKAISEFREAAPSKGVLFNLGIATAKSGDNQRAISHFDEVLQLDSSLGVAYLTRGVCKYHIRDYEGAVADFDKALETMGYDMSVDFAGEGLRFELTKVDLHFNKALALMELGRVVEGLENVALARAGMASNTLNRQGSLDKLEMQLKSSLTNTGYSPTSHNKISTNSSSSNGHTQASPSVVATSSLTRSNTGGVQVPPSPPLNRSPSKKEPSALGKWKAMEKPPALIFSLKALTGPPPYPDGVDVTRREMHLSDEDFVATFSCSKTEWDEFPKWKQEVIKKKKGFF